MSTPTSPTNRQTRSFSNASSGDRTVRPRRRSTSSALTLEDSLDDSEGINGASSAEEGEVKAEEPARSTHPSTWSTNIWSDKLRAPAPPPLWREASDHGFDESEDPEEGPSDYWSRPSTALAPDLSTAAPTDPWLRFDPPDVPTPDAADEDDGGHADTAEYSKRLEQVLSLADQSPTPSPTRRRDRNRKMFVTGAADDSTDEDSWNERHLPSGNGYEAAVRRVLHDSAGGTDDDNEEDEFGALPVHPRVSLGAPDGH